MKHSSVILFILLCFNLKAQYFEKQLINLNFDYIGNLEYTLDSNLIISGQRNSGLYFVKTNLNGDSLWTKNILDSNYVQKGFFINQLPNSNFHVAVSVDSAMYWSEDARYFIFDSTFSQLQSDVNYPSHNTLDYPIAAARSNNRSHIAVMNFDNAFGPSNEYFNVYPGATNLLCPFWSGDRVGLAISDIGMSWWAFTDVSLYNGIKVWNQVSSDTLTIHYKYPTLVANGNGAFLFVSDYSSASPFSNGLALFSLSPNAQASFLKHFSSFWDIKPVCLFMSNDSTLYLEVEMYQKIAILHFDQTGNYLSGYISPSSIVPLRNSFRQLEDSSLALLAVAGSDPYLIRTDKYLQSSSPYSITVNDSILCEGDSILLSVNANTNIAWANGDTGSSIFVHYPGFYWATITDTTGQFTTQVIYIDEVSFPQSLLVSDTTVCDSIILIPGSYSSYLWQDGSSDSTYLANITGTYIVQVSHNGCSKIDSVNITIPNPQITLGSDTIVCVNNTVVYDAGIGFTYLWHNLSTSQTFHAISSIEDTLLVSVMVTDSFLCNAYDTVQVLFQICSLIDKQDKYDLENVIFPNPIDDFLYLGFSDETGSGFTISIYDVLGEMKFQKYLENASEVNEIDVRNLSAGLYFLKMDNENRIFKFIKQ